MVNKLKQTGRWNSTLLLTGMSIFCLVLSIIRLYITDSYMYLFLNWNLFLAFIPWLISTLIVIRNYSTKKWVVYGLLFIWLLFFPNSPYILTDLFHLRSNSAAPIWFDWALVLSFAWTGLMFGFISLNDIEKILSQYVKNKTILPLLIVLLFVSGFGVYIGRFLRWNSWDIIRSPIDLGEDILYRILHPFHYARTWVITFLMGALLNMMYFSIRLLRK